MTFKVLFALYMLPVFVFANSELFKTIEKIGVGMQGYTLGAILNDRQRKTAKSNPEKANVAGTFKFKDDELHIIADSKSDRIVVVYQAYDNVNSEMMKNLVSRYISTFDAPTTLSHNNIVYWFYHENGQKITSDEFEAWRAKINRSKSMESSNKPLAEILKMEAVGGDEIKLHKLVTVKLQSTEPIIGKEADGSASVYLMISSEKLIRDYYGIGGRSYLGH